MKYATPSAFRAALEQRLSTIAQQTRVPLCPSVLQCLTDSAGACPLDCGGTAVLSGFFRWPAQIPETRSPYLR
jgi:hypothetical protein